VRSESQQTFNLFQTNKPKLHFIHNGYAEQKLVTASDRQPTEVGKLLCTLNLKLPVLAKQYKVEDEKQVMLFWVEKTSLHILEKLKVHPLRALRPERFFLGGGELPK
jgi:hypothetical protein